MYARIFIHIPCSIIHCQKVDVLYLKKKKHRINKKSQSLLACDTHMNERRIKKSVHQHTMRATFTGLKIQDLIHKYWINPLVLSGSWLLPPIPPHTLLLWTPYFEVANRDAITNSIMTALVWSTYAFYTPCAHICSHKSQNQHQQQQHQQQQHTTSVFMQWT